MVERRRVAVAISAIVVVGLYVASAAVSGHLSPLARRPLLDGTLPPQPYRWVDPPAALAADNEPPTPGTFDVALGPSGSKTAVFTTDDAQVTLILAKDALATAPDQRSVQVTITPLAAKDVGEPEAPLLLAGNAVRIEAAYQPSGDAVDAVAAETARVVLVYPFALNEHGGHSVVGSADGRTWRELETNDLPSILQADALIDVLGYVAVARDPTATSAPSASPEGSAGGSAVATIAIVAGLVVLAGAATLLLRRGTK
jgi:hypothetical protein